jgi:hypothetical protein
MSIESHVAHAVIASHCAGDEFQARAARRSAGEAMPTFASITRQGREGRVCLATHWQSLSNE